MTTRHNDSLSRFPLVFALVAFACIAPVACKTLYVGAVTLTGIVDSASKEYAAAYQAGLVPPDVATKASAAHLEYRKAAGVAADALTAYKLGQTADVAGTLEAARVAASHFIEALVGLLPKERTVALKAQVAKAGAL